MLRMTYAIIIILLFTACAGNQKAPIRSAKYYFSEAEKFFAAEDYIDAIAMYEKAKESYFSSELAAASELRIADSKYMRDEYIEAAEAYDEFLKNHTDHPMKADIIFRIGHAYFEEKLSIDRDPTYTENSLGAFQQFRAEYPDDRRTDEAKRSINICLTILADHERYIAKFYFKSKDYKAAIQRLINMYKTYPDHSHTPETFYLLGVAQLRDSQIDDAAETLNYLEATFPESKYTKKARKELKKHQ